MATRRVHYTPADKARSVYQYVEVEVPEAAPALSVAVGYDRDVARLDLGLMDPGGFRGWSGSERDRITVTPAAATPGYLAGPLPAGTWRVVVGLYELPDDGVDVEVTTGLDPATPELPPPPEPLPDRPAPRDLPRRTGHRWLAGDFHTHTVHSDGELWPDQLACRARALGLDVLAVTDHNTVSHHQALPAAAARTGVVLVPGQEVTTESGHATLLGPMPWVDFRTPAAGWLTAAERAGALMSIAHPVAGPWSWAHPMPHPTPLVEGWHGSWDGRWPDCYEWAVRHGGVLVGGSDFHRDADWARLGVPTTYVEVAGEPTPQAVLDALRAGRVAISAAPDAPVLLRHDGALVAVDAAGTTLCAPDGTLTELADGPVRLDLPAGPTPYRLLDADGRCVAFAR